MSLFLAILTTVSKYEKLPENGHSMDLHSHGIYPNTIPHHALTLLPMPITLIPIRECGLSKYLY